MNDERLDRRISRTLREVAAGVPVADRLAEITDDTPRPTPRAFRQLPVLVAIGAFVLGIVLVGGVLLLMRNNTNEPSVAPVTTTSPTTTSAVTTTATTVPPNLVVGGIAEGYTAVDAALQQARERWEQNGLEEYGYVVTIECDCPDAGSAWVGRFQDGPPDRVDHSVERLFDEVATAVAGQPERIEAEFDTNDGHLVAYQVVDAGGDRKVSVSGYHQISRDPSPFDGTWRLVEGSLDGATFKSPATGIIELTIDRSTGTYPSDCNDVYVRVDIYGSSFGAGNGIITAVGCGEYTSEAELFDQAIHRANTIELGDGLLLRGPGVELRFDPATQADVLGALQPAVAGDRISFEIPDGRQRTDQYLITPVVGSDHVFYLLTAENSGNDNVASWEDWTGEPEQPGTPVSGPGPDTIVLPDPMYVGDYALCSPYWVPDQFCFTLQVRLPSAPWIVTAGRQGIILHDVNGTSETLTTEPARVAFWVDGTLVYQQAGASALSVVDPSGAKAEVPLQDGEMLLDVAPGGVAVTSDAAATYLVDLGSGARTVAGPAAVEARFTGELVVARTGDGSVQAFEPGGAVLWERSVAPDTMLSLDAGRVRLDTFEALNTDNGPAYYQYVSTELIDQATGLAEESFRWEVAIPFDGDEIAAPCLRTEIHDSVMLCTEPDGRAVTLPVATGDGGGSGDGHTLLADVTSATYVRQSP
jgi:hypothetical protein